MRGDLPTPVSVVHTPLTQHAQHVVMHVTLHEHAWHVVLWRGKVVAHSTPRRQPRADTRAGASRGAHVLMGDSPRMNENFFANCKWCS